jgi:cytoskeletal protein RodZ
MTAIPNAVAEEFFVPAPTASPPAVYPNMPNLGTLVGMPKENKKEQPLETKKPSEAKSVNKRNHNWIWVLLIVLVAILVTGGIALFILMRPITVVQQAEPEVRAGSTNSTKNTVQTQPKSSSNSASGSLLDSGRLNQ